jgi:hypothetical protein
MNIAQAVKSLQPSSEFIIENEDYSTVTWVVTPETIPTQAEVDAEVIRLQAVYDAQDYARKRKAKYDLLNQDEMRFDDQVNSTTTWVDAINAIKTAHPKP